MRNYVERAKDFIAEVFPYIENHLDSPWALRNHIRQYNADYTRHVLVANGSARVALITSDYVIKWDYDDDSAEEIGGCRNEVYLYDLALKDGFAYLFAEITPFSFNGHDFYIMPRIRYINDNNGRGWNYMTDKERVWCEAHYLVDLHCNNFGFRNGKICIVDYAYQSDETEEEESPFSSLFQTTSPHFCTSYFTNRTSNRTSYR